MALLLPPLSPHRRRAGRLILQEAARAGDGKVLDAASGEVLLLGCLAQATERAASTLAALGLAEARPVPLAADTAALQAWAEASLPLARPDPAAAEPPDAAAARLALGPLVVHRAVLRLGPGVEPRWLARRIVLSRSRVAAALGQAALADPERLEAVVAAAEARLAALPPPVVDGPAAAAPAMLRPGPEDAPPPDTGAIAVLPVSTLAAGEQAWAARAGRLRASGWGGLALDGLDAALVGLLDPRALPPEPLLLLRWSPALADRAGMAALRHGFDPARLVLTGCDATEDALGWGLAAGIRIFAGPAVEALLAAVRRRAGAGPARA